MIPRSPQSREGRTVCEVWVNDEASRSTTAPLSFSSHARARVPEDASTRIELDVTTGEPKVMDPFGPIVVNSDGTLARIANWSEMTEKEQTVTKADCQEEFGAFAGAKVAVLSTKLVSALKPQISVGRTREKIAGARATHWCVEVVAREIQ